MADPLALLDRVIAQLPAADSSRCSRSQLQQNAPTGTVKSLAEKGVPVVPVVPVAKQETLQDRDSSRAERNSQDNGQEEAPLSLSSKTTGTTGTTGFGQEFRGFRSSRCTFPNGNDGNSPAPEPARASPKLFNEDAAVAAGVPRAWAEGVARLQAMACPRGIDPERWRQVIDDAGRFTERHAVEAAVLGWDTVNIFGVHPLKPAQRTDCMGLVWLLRGREVIEMTAEVASIGLPGGGLHTYSRREKPEAVPIWQLQGGENKPYAPRQQPRCCECNEAIIEPVSAWLGGEPVHRECGERASASRPESTAGPEEAAA